MMRTAAIALSLAGLAFIPASVALAENAPPSYQADPSVYKVIFEDDHFRVISATWKAGQTDKAHSHPVPSIAYGLSTCTLKLQDADGKTREAMPKKGAATTVPITASHTATNTGTKTCHALLIERK